MPFVTSSFLFLVVWPGAPSSVLAPSSDALVTSSFLLLVRNALLGLLRHTCGNELWIPLCDSEEELASRPEPQQGKTASPYVLVGPSGDGRAVVRRLLSRQLICCVPLFSPLETAVAGLSAAMRFNPAEPTVVV